VRSRVVRPYKATGHRHTAEIEAMLSAGGDPARVHLSITAVEMVRGAAAAAHVFLNQPLTDKDLWGIFRGRYGAEPFVRLVNERTGPYRLPEPKLLAGTNFADVGWELDPFSDRLVVVAAIDNLVKGAAGQAVQAMNLMMGWDETVGLGFTGLHPV
jgi:N-acetyl-gamma-glutamyl-phosphate/LysW-gamma-L-alpha-aminoadipyl-6-phosphate reductase